MRTRNPTLEEQAFGRIHRIGQKKEVTTIRFFIRSSFEEVLFVASLNNECKRLTRLKACDKSPAVQEGASGYIPVASRWRAGE